VALEPGGVTADPDIQAVREDLMRHHPPQLREGESISDLHRINADALAALDRLAARLELAEAARETLQRECAEEHVLRGAYLEQIGRAETAEAEVDRLNHDAATWERSFRDAEARVARLEEEIED
jgi:hypothetical protein